MAQRAILLYTPRRASVNNCTAHAWVDASYLRHRLEHREVQSQMLKHTRIVYSPRALRQKCVTSAIWIAICHGETHAIDRRRLRIGTPIVL